MLDNRYEILESIGTGGMAVVYKARCHRLNRLVAVKILKSDLAEDADFRRRFHDESQAVAMLSHPNILAVYDVSRSSNVEYLVMELLDGITLKQYMQKKGVLSWREALHFITQIMKALGHAHSRGIIHRDIKPQNIMVLRDGSVKVTDFGIARLTSSSQSTLTQEALGSVHYISPEQAKGSHIDARSDIYSAGVVLYEMTTGRLPYEGDSPVSVAIQHINSIPLHPREINPDIQEALEIITMKAMASKVENRYTSADEMLADLEEFRKNPNISFEYTPEDFLREEAGNEPTQVLPRGVGARRASEPTRRGRQAPEPQEDGDVYDPPRRRSWAPMGIAVGAILILVAGLCYFLYVVFLSGLFEPPPETLLTPGVVGERFEEVLANEEYSEKGFTFILGKTLPDEKYPAGVIIAQDPEADRAVKGNLQITVDVSAGMSAPTMPDLAGEDQRIAKIRLDALGLELTYEFELVFSDTIAKNYVISTQPEKGVTLARGDTIVMVVSDGPEEKPVTMPSLTDLTEEQAKAQIITMKLVLGTVTPVKNDKAAGTVVGQSVRATTEVPEGTVIDLEISTGPEPPPDTVDPNAHGLDDDPLAEPVHMPIQIVLPDGAGMVEVVIMQEGVAVIRQSVDRSQRYVTYTLAGNGLQFVEVYFDGVLADSRYISFEA